MNVAALIPLVGPDFCAVGGSGQLRVIVGALLTYGLIVAVLIVVTCGATYDRIIERKLAGRGQGQDRAVRRPGEAPPSLVAHTPGPKEQLGHASKTVTERHYINRRLVVPDYRAATERLAPRTEPTDDPAIGP